MDECMCLVLFSTFNLATPAGTVNWHLCAVDQSLGRPGNVGSITYIKHENNHIS